MLAEKFFLMLETIISHASDGSPRVVSTSPRVPIKPPNATVAAGRGAITAPGRSRTW
jgi:hypothetical protein